MDKRVLLPLAAETRALIYDINRNVIRQAISHAAEIQSVEGADISGAIIPREEQNPPSPV